MFVMLPCDEVAETKITPDGSASVKVLFTTADLAALKNTFIWTANTSSPKQIKRSLRPMRLVQIDVAIKDSKIVGTNKDADNWLMTTYYFDETLIAGLRQQIHTFGHRLQMEDFRLRFHRIPY